MRAGLLNRRVHLQKPAMASDAEGVSSENWSDLDMVWAHINPYTARELFAAAQPEELLTHQVTIRWRSDVTTHMRFLYQEKPTDPFRIFLIHTMLDPDEGHKELDCLCEEVVTVLVGET
jgi:SPP1 family predicted phage head-tail adaptor